MDTIRGAMNETNQQIVGVGFPAGGNLHKAHENVEKYLEEKHGVRLEPAERLEGLAQNFGPSLINRYIFGKGNVLITGQAAGFFNMLAEGMSCALHSGAIAGESIVEAMQRNRPVQEVYRTLIASEVKRCTDQWNPIQIIFGNPHEADFKASFGKLSRKEKITVVTGPYELSEDLCAIQVGPSDPWAISASHDQGRLYCGKMVIVMRVITSFERYSFYICC